MSFRLTFSAQSAQATLSAARVSARHENAEDALADASCSEIQMKSPAGAACSEVPKNTGTRTHLAQAKRHSPQGRTRPRQKQGPQRRREDNEAAHDVRQSPDRSHARYRNISSRTDWGARSYFSGSMENDARPCDRLRTWDE